jgi:hypothetical protein
VTQGGVDATDPTWSRDGSRIAFVLDTGTHDIYRADTSGPNVNVTPVVASPSDDEMDPAYAPNSNKIAFSRKVGADPYALWTVNDDGTSLTKVLAVSGITNADLTQPNWSSDGAKLAFRSLFIPPSAAQHDTYTVNANGTGVNPLSASGTDENSPAWSPQGNMVAYADDADIYTINPDATGRVALATRPTTTDDHPDWQPVVAAQVRPKGASPMYLPLVPAFNQCTVPNATHAMPFGAPSCSPPRETSSDLTVGEPAVNGKGANFVGSVTITALASGDARIAVSVTDVRCAHTFAGGCTGGPLSDYTGNMYLDYEFRITDRSNPAGTAGTMEDVLGINLNWPCTATADPTVGSSCPAVTTLNTLYPGLIVSGRRAVWRLRSLALKDANNNEFAVPGTFYP